MLPNNDKNNEILPEEVKLLGKKKEREEVNYISKEEAFNIYQYKSKYIPKDIELIKSYSKDLFQRLNQSPLEIVNIVISPIAKFNDYFLEVYNNLLEKIKQIPTSKKKIIKYMYNNGVIHNEPPVFPCESNDVINDIEKNNNDDSKKEESNDIIKEDNNNSKDVTNPYFVTLNSREVWESLKEYKWEGLIKIIILFGDNGFIKQILKNIDYYHNNYLILNLNTIDKEQKAHFNNIISDIYSFIDIISCLKQDIYDHSKGKSNNKLISEKFNEYNDLLKRHLYYNCNTDQNIVNNEKNYLIHFNFRNKNIININKNELALYDPNSCSKTFISICYTCKLQNENNYEKLPNFINPKVIENSIGVELSISNNIYNILNPDYNEENINIHINDLTLNKKMIGYTYNKITKNKFYLDYNINNTLLNYALCDYICNIFNMRLYSNNINLNTIEIHLYEFTNYNIKCLIAKEYLANYNPKYDKEVLDCFSHFSFCISYGKIIIENIKEYDGKIFSFDIYKDRDESSQEENINIFRFFCYHKCNKYCNILGLKSIDKNFYDVNPDNIDIFKNKRICGICKSIFKINSEYKYNRDNLCLCYECYNKIYNSKYIRACVNCGNKFEYLYNYYILQRIETPSLCQICEKIKIDEKNENIEEDKNQSIKINEIIN